MKHQNIFFLIITLTFLWPESEKTIGQSSEINIINNKKATDAIEKWQLKKIHANKDTLTALVSAVLSGEFVKKEPKPKIVYRNIYRTILKEVHDTIFIPIEKSEEIIDYITETPCPDTVIKYIEVPIIKESFFKRIFKRHNKL